MAYLLDTHALIWAAAEPARFSPEVIALLEDERNLLFFSAASIWEIAIKTALNKPHFTINAQMMAAALLRAGYRELPISAHHAAAVAGLPPMHQDPFDRLLVAQARSEGLTLVTNDGNILRYCCDYIDIVPCH